MSERDPNRIVLDAEDVNVAFDLWYERERKERNFGVNRDEQRGFREGLIAANVIIARRLERQSNEQ